VDGKGDSLMYDITDYKNIDCLFERSNQQLLVNRKQRNLLIRSEATKAYKFLYNMLLENKVIDYDSLNSNSEYIKFFSSDTYYKLLEDSLSEWVLLNTVYKLNSKINCELCGYPILSVYTIVNVKNTNILRVGKSCGAVFKIL